MIPTFVPSAFTGALLSTPHTQTSAVTASALPPLASRPSRRTILAGAAAAVLAVVTVPFLPSPALADHTQQAARRSYDRYVPRIEAGIGEARIVGAAIKTGDLATAKDLASAKTFNVKFRRALSIYATSFSDSNINKQSIELIACVNGFFLQVDKAVNAKDADEAVAEWNLASDALAAYIRVARILALKDMKPLSV